MLKIIEKNESFSIIPVLSRNKDTNGLNALETVDFLKNLARGYEVIGTNDCKVWAEYLRNLAKDFERQFLIDLEAFSPCINSKEYQNVSYFYRQVINSITWDHSLMGRDYHECVYDSLYSKDDITYIGESFRVNLIVITKMFVSAFNIGLGLKKVYPDE